MFEDILKRYSHRPDAGGWWLSIPEAAGRARIAPATLWKWVREGRVQAYGARGALRVKLADVLRPWPPSPEDARH